MDILREHDDSTQPESGYTKEERLPIAAEESSQFPTVTFTVGKASDGTPQSKSFSLVEGELEARPPKFASRGTAKVVQCTLDQIPDYFQDPNSFMVLGVANGMSAGQEYAHKAEQAPGPGISRTKANYAWPIETAALALIDIDLKSENIVPSMEKWLAAKPLFVVNDALEQINRVLASVRAPRLEGVAILARRSASAGISADGDLLKDSKGAHVFLALKGKTPGELLDFLHKKLV